MDEDNARFVNQTVKNHRRSVAEGQAPSSPERIPGETLCSTWPHLSDGEKDHIAKQTADALAQLQTVQSSRLESFQDKQFYDVYLFRSNYDEPYGNLDE